MASFYTASEVGTNERQSSRCEGGVEAGPSFVLVFGGNSTSRPLDILASRPLAAEVA